MKTKHHIAIAAAGTGGHIFPGISIGQGLEQRGFTISWVGTHQGMSLEKVKPLGWSYLGLNFYGKKGRFGRYLWPLKLIIATVLCVIYFKKNGVNRVLVMGGFISLPAALAARALKINLSLHEQNVIPGQANKIISQWAEHCFAAFEGTALPNVTIMGNPQRFTAQDAITKHTGPLRILIVGGSQGAQFLNQHVSASLANDIKQPLSIYHQCGRGEVSAVKSIYEQSNHHVNVISFINDMASAYQWADVVIARSGAMTISECIQMLKPALFIPLPTSALNHQHLNAEWLVARDGADMIAQAEWSSELLLSWLEDIQHVASREKRVLVLKDLQEDRNIIDQILDQWQIQDEKSYQDSEII